MEGNFKSGFIAIIGRPNVGKSTLLNRLVANKIAITSDKAQTTRNRIQGIYTDDEAQMIFIDTPGIHKPKHQLGSFMNKQAFSALDGVDCVLILVNAEQEIGPGDRLVIERGLTVDVPVYLLINKIDLVKADHLLEIIASYTEEYDFAEVFPISATEGDNVPELIEKIKEVLPEGPMYYPADQLTDHPERFVVAELIREKVLHLTREEVPHSIAVQVQQMQVNEDDKLEIQASIIVERDSQKGIIIGKQGAMIKRIGSLARRDIESLLNQKVYLDLWVRVDKNWRDRPEQLSEYGYDPNNYR